MCRGREEDQSHNSLSLCINTKGDADQAQNSPCCELCSAKAILYCQADDAFLCAKCDRWVHGANFLARRHLRCLLCRACGRLTQRYLVGTSPRAMLPTVVRENQIQGSQCNSNLENKDSRRAVKEPLLFL